MMTVAVMMMMMNMFGFSLLEERIMSQSKYCSLSPSDFLLNDYCMFLEHLYGLFVSACAVYAHEHGVFVKGHRMRTSCP